MSNSAQSGNANLSNGTSQNELRRTFIAMLFALVAATIAQQIAELLFVITGGWDLASSPSKMWENLISGNGMLFASLTHSFLALLMVSMSWVMWSKSQAAGHKTEITHIFSKEFVLLLIEVFLVVLYFAIAKTMEQNFTEYMKDKNISAYVGVASARPEALQMMWVFSVFFVWDVIVDVIYSPRTPHPVLVRERFYSFIQGLLTYCSISLLCVFAAWMVSRAAPSAGTPYEALWGDISLIALLLFFALGKQLEYFAIKFFPGEDSRKNTKRDHPPSTKAAVMMVFLAAVYIYSMMVLIWPPSFLK
ncbi:hypothetical protein [Pseudomonas sp. HY13-MNA-CIBAN-0226]|uniref:hypothetical protein n=1 Tax=Pseudomonas sp. HY13-MNA-CIBAN-0226 TaxID=3140473 RepID=UPI00331CCF83